MSWGAGFSLGTLQETKAKALNGALEGGQGRLCLFLWGPGSPILASVLSSALMPHTSTREGCPMGKGGRPSSRAWNQTSTCKALDLGPEHSFVSTNAPQTAARKEGERNWRGDIPFGRKFPNHPTTLQSASALRIGVRPKAGLVQAHHSSWSSEEGHPPHCTGLMRPSLGVSSPTGPAPPGAGGLGLLTSHLILRMTNHLGLARSTLAGDHHVWVSGTPETYHISFRARLAVHPCHTLD